MIKKTIKYIDFNDREVVKDYYFHLTKVDMVEISLDGKFEEMIRRAAATGDKLTIFKEFKRLISMSVGMRSEDGSDFIRTAEFTKAFVSSPAFDELIMELFTSDDQGTAFIRGLMPAGMQAELDKELAKKVNTETSAPNPFSEEPAWVRDRRVPSKEEFAAATPEQKMLAFQLQSDAQGS